MRARLPVLAAVVLGASLHIGLSKGPVLEVPPKHTTLLANLSTQTPKYAKPGAKTPDGVILPTWESHRSILPVIAEKVVAKQGWYKVRLAPRPNGSVAWIKAGAKGVSFDFTPYSIVVNLKLTHLALYEYGKQIGWYPAGVGKASTPTPTGSFFVAYVANPPSPSYGPFIDVTSAHSNVIKIWDGDFNANIGIHGPLGTDTEIGTKGTYESHGCIRLHNSNLVHLLLAPPGTPVSIVS